MRFARIAERLGSSTRMLRRYEQSGIIEIPRDENGHRRVTPEELERLREAIEGYRAQKRLAAPSHVSAMVKSTMR